MKVGDLVQWNNVRGSEPLAIIVEKTSGKSSYHSRIRVSWIDTPLPIQASSTSTSGNRVSAWIKPDKFRIFSQIN
jgi:hypothetical protein|tara:strand:- start:99 stop:323 length:225 start_codon:yes stop_codon:yes gene_type:complete